MLAYTLRQLEYFVAAANYGSVARAAEHLHVSQPSVSTAIGKLEDQLGVQLFLRQHAQGVALTAAGRRLHREARDLLRQAEDFYDSARSADSAITGELALGCFLTLGPLFMPALVTSFTASTTAAWGTRPPYPLTMSSIFSPVARRSKVPVTSMRVYLNVGRPPHTPTARTTWSPKG